MGNTEKKENFFIRKLINYSLKNNYKIKVLFGKGFDFDIVGHIGKNFDALTLTEEIKIADILVIFGTVNKKTEDYIYTLFSEAPKHSLQLRFDPVSENIEERNTTYPKKNIAINDGAIDDINEQLYLAINFLNEKVLYQ